MSWKISDLISADEKARREFHLAKAREYRSLVDAGEHDGGENEGRYHFHLEMAKEWGVFVEEGLRTLRSLRADLGEENFYKSAHAFHSIVGLVKVLEAKGDLEEAGKQYSELTRFAPVLEQEGVQRNWDFSRMERRDRAYERRIQKLEKELASKGECPFISRPTVAQRLRGLGDLAGGFGDAAVRKRSFALAARQLEPYVYNVRDSLYPSGTLLIALYGHLQWHESQKQYCIWLFQRSKRNNDQFRSFLLERLGLLSTLQARSEMSGKYYSAAAGEYMKLAGIYDKPRYNLGAYCTAHAASLYLRAGKTEEARETAKGAIPALESFYGEDYTRSWGDCSEHLTRCYGIIGEGKKAREHAGDAKSRYGNLLEDGELVPYELILEGRMNPYIGLGLCEETLGNLDSAAEWFSKAEGAYQRLLDSRKDVRDYVSLLSDWKNAAILCGSMRKKVELKRDGATTSKGEEFLTSFFELAETTWGVPFGLLEEDLHEFCNLIAGAYPDLLRDESEKPYWSTEEEGFIRKLGEKGKRENP